MVKSVLGIIKLFISLVLDVSNYVFDDVLRAWCYTLLLGDFFIWFLFSYLVIVYIDGLIVFVILAIFLFLLRYTLLVSIAYMKPFL